jgi:hypothetical protein
MDSWLSYARRAYVADETTARLEMVARSHWDLYRRKRLDVDRRGRFNVVLLYLATRVEVPTGDCRLLRESGRWLKGLLQGQLGL